MPSLPASKSTARFDPIRIRRDFPGLSGEVHGKPLIYLDNAATAQRPQAMIDACTHYYTHLNANIHRGVHRLSEQATDRFEATRDAMRTWINAPARENIIFTRGVTEGVNLVSQSYLRPRLQPGDRILITTMEHHSNIVPWQLLCEQTGAELDVIRINACGELIMEDFNARLTDRVRMLAMVHVSNAMGTINPVREMIAAAREKGIATLVDGAQAMPHMRVDVQSLECDFYCISGHKMFAPTGIGVLYGRGDLLAEMPPYHGGGDMIRRVTFDKTTYNDPPSRFEAGTPNIVGVIGLGATIEYLQSIDFDAAMAHEQTLLEHATCALSEIDGLRLIGTAQHKSAVLSFTLDGIHPHDLGTMLDHQGIAIRTGHHCAMPLMDHFGVPGTARASMAMYNTHDEVDALVAGIHQAMAILA